MNNKKLTENKKCSNKLLYIYICVCVYVCAYEAHCACMFVLEAMSVGIYTVQYMYNTLYNTVCMPALMYTVHVQNNTVVTRSDLLF